MSKKKVLNGMFYVDEYYDKDLSLIPYAQAGVNIGVEGEFTVYTLRSYSTNILSLYTTIKSKDKFLVIGNVSYSRTTIKHVNAFLKEYCPVISYYFLKDIYRKNDEIMVVHIPENYKDFEEDFDIMELDDFYDRYIQDPYII